ncbi:hypothetical protein [Streptomyces afghaniensis]|uniref:hypothetical protein n=1 Tax=Streptomyces afghaniensis TaxID=66865 RepID=UPI002784A00E|nr:hypothetical protein [Streptomyces afghaniensis]MDQ1013684.1 hypothetical protein [Streptomyces afghaniensis]
MTHLAAAVDAEADNGERTDKVWVVPSPVARAVGAVAGRFMPLVKDMAAMFSWFGNDRYVADPRRRQQLFGRPVPTAEDALGRRRVWHRR